MNHEILEIKKTSGGKIAPTENIVFDTVSQATPNIDVDSTTGVLTFRSLGQYVAEWWVATDTARRGAMQFALKTSIGDRIIGNSPAKRGQVSGSGVINVEEVGVTASLINISADAVILSPTVAQTAFLLVTRVPESGKVGPTGPQGESGADGISPHIDVDSGNWFVGNVDTGVPARGPAGPTAATIPFAVNKNDTNLTTDVNGAPQMIVFSGFGAASYDTMMYLQEGEWAAGTITVKESDYLGSSFIMPRDAVLRTIHVLFCNDYLYFEENSSVRPFVCLAVSDGNALVFNILKDTIVYVDPYPGGVEILPHTFRKAALSDLDIKIAEGSLVAIIAGMVAENVTQEQNGRFSISGGLYLE